MAHVYTKTGYAKPVVTLSLVAGGSLEPNTTYFYRAITGTSQYYHQNDYRSAASDVKSIATDTTNLSVKIDIVHSTAVPEYTYIWVAKDVDPGTGGWNDRTGDPVIVFLGQHSYNMGASGFAKIDTLTDDGITYGWFSYIYEITSTNYGFCPFHESAKDKLTVDGGTDLDPVTFDTIYAEAVAQGWDENSTIKKIDTVPDNDWENANRITYALNFRELNMTDAAEGNYFKDGDKTIHVNDCQLAFFAETYIGVYDEEPDLTNDGINFVLTGHGVAFGNVRFDSSTGPCRIYDTTFVSRKGTFSSATCYGALLQQHGLDWEMIDVKVGGPSAYPGFNAGLEIYGANPDGSSLLRRVESYRNRYTGYLFPSAPFKIEDCKFTGPSSGLWLRHTDDAARVFHGVVMAGWAESGSPVIGSVRVDNSTSRTFCTMVDAEVYDYGQVYWYVRPGGVAFFGSYFDFKFTVNVRVTDQNGDIINGATVVMLNKDNDEQFSEDTGGDGRITEGLAKKYRALPDLTKTASHYQKDIPDYFFDYAPFTLTVEAAGFDTYTWIGDIDEAVDWDISLQVTGQVQAQGIIATVEDGLRVEV